MARLLVDINVLVDVFERREPHYRCSREFIRTALRAEADLLVPAHGVTTIHYLTRRFRGKVEADDLLGWLIDSFEIAPATKATFQRAHQLGWKDFEDAVVAVMAEGEGCDYIVTRDLGDFADAPVPAISPEKALSLVGRWG